MNGFYYNVVELGGAYLTGPFGFICIGASIKYQEGVISVQA